MNLELALLFIVFGVLRKENKRKNLYPSWDKYLIAAYFVTTAMIFLPRLFKGYDYITQWIGHAYVLTIIVLVLLYKAFKPAKQIVYALIPIFAISLVEDIVEIINFNLYKKWDRYFDIASIFALVWMFAMLIINNRQRKALEKERLKAEEQEKERIIAEKMKVALEIQVKERTAEITRQKEELQNALDDLRQVQKQLIQSEKMASLGELTAGIAHEIQNPLNFVNNFAEVNRELLAEMNEEIAKGNLEEVKSLAKDIIDNEEKITHHGKRADAIVKGMLQHSRNSSGQKEPANINVLADEYLRLAYHGLRAKDKTFNATIKTDFDDSIGNINIIPQDIGRVILNLITNAFYAVTERRKNATSLSNYDPTVTVITRKTQQAVEIIVQDNGMGIPAKVLDKIFQPFFTTKPTGQGTGLGLSMSYEIVTKAHGGELKVNTKEGEGTSFIIHLPLNK
ncbi:MAG: GHKL domain-containing protein [Bacteroidetes bacterium]|nr:GHKL domain-containing protein [Bacteroidota bacterium]